jgi:hypothetical protein
MRRRALQRGYFSLIPHCHIHSTGDIRLTAPE